MNFTSLGFDVSPFARELVIFFQMPNQIFFFYFSFRRFHGGLLGHRKGRTWAYKSPLLRHPFDLNVAGHHQVTWRIMGGGGGASSGGLVRGLAVASGAASGVANAAAAASAAAGAWSPRALTNLFVHYENPPQETRAK